MPLFPPAPSRVHTPHEKIQYTHCTTARQRASKTNAIQWSRVILVLLIDHELQCSGERNMWTSGAGCYHSKQGINSFQKNRKKKISALMTDKNSLCQALFVFLMGFLQCTSMSHTAAVLLIFSSSFSALKRTAFPRRPWGFGISEVLINIWLDRLWGGGADDLSDSVQNNTVDNRHIPKIYNTNTNVQKINECFFIFDSRLWPLITVLAFL